MDITGLSPQTLRRAADLQEKIQSLQEELTQLLGGGKPLAPGAPAGKRWMSAAGRARISAAAKARWAKLRKERAAGTAKPQKRRLSAAGKAAISAAAKARWAKFRSAAKA